MKLTHLLLISAFTVSASAAFAGAPGKACCSANACRSTAKPAPVKVVTPTDLSRAYQNLTVEVALTIDEKGVPHDVRPYGAMPRDLAKRLLPVVSQWRFSPAVVDGHPVSGRYVLPIELVERA